MKRKILFSSIGFLSIGSLVTVGGAVGITSCSRINKATTLQFSGDGIVYDGSSWIPGAKHTQAPLWKPGDLFYNVLFVDEDGNPDSVQDPIWDIAKSQAHSFYGATLSQRGHSLHVTWLRDAVSTIPASSLVIDAFVKSKSNPALSKEVIANIDLYDINGIDVNVPSSNCLGHIGQFTTSSSIRAIACNNNVAGIEGIGYSVKLVDGSEIPDWIHPSTTATDDNNLIVEWDYEGNTELELDIYIDAWSLKNDDIRIPEKKKVTIIADSTTDMKVSGETVIETFPGDQIVRKTYTATYYGSSPDIDSKDNTSWTVTDIDNQVVSWATIDPINYTDTTTTATLLFDSENAPKGVYNLIITATSTKYSGLPPSHITISINAHGPVDDISIDPPDGYTFGDGSARATATFTATVNGINVLPDVTWVGKILMQTGSATFECRPSGPKQVVITITTPKNDSGWLTFTLKATSKQDTTKFLQISATGNWNNILP